MSQRTTTLSDLEWIKNELEKANDPELIGLVKQLILDREEDLREMEKMILEGEDDIKEGRVYSIESVRAEIKTWAK